MSKDIIATCPQCGAQGKAGMFCEYCGTKIPMLVKKAKNTPPKDTKKAFSWYNVCPQEYEPDPKAVIGNYKDSLFMVVKSKNDDFFELVRGVINRDGIFVVDPTRSSVRLFVDNNDYIVGGELYNLLTGDRIFPDIDYLSYEESEKYLFSWGGQKPYRIFNRITRTEINLDKPIPCSYNIIEVDTNDCIVFSNYRNTYTENEVEVEGDKVDCYVEITGNHGIVTFQTKNEPQKEEPKETIKTETKQPTKAQESKSGCGKTFGCLFVLLVCVILGVVFWNNYSQQQEAQHQREVAVADSIRREAEAKKMAELEKKRNYRPASPKPSKPDVEVVGLTVGVKTFSMSEYSSTEILYFDKKGYLTKVQSPGFGQVDQYIIKEGKVISKNGEDYEYKKMASNRDCVYYNDFLQYEIKYDSKNRISSIVSKYSSGDHAFSFTYDEGNNAFWTRKDEIAVEHEVSEPFIPAFVITGCFTLHMPTYYHEEDGVLDDRGRLVELTTDNKKYKITYWQ